MAFAKASENEQLWITATNRAEAAERALADAQAMADKYKADTIELNATVTELQAAKAQAEEDAHYANGVTDLALQRRDTAERERDQWRDDFVTSNDALANCHKAMRDALDELPGMSDAATGLSNAMNKPPHNNAALDTAEAQVAVLTSSLEQLISACTAERNPRYTYAPALDAVDAARTVLASLPDSAAKLRAVVDAAEALVRDSPDADHLTYGKVDSEDFLGTYDDLVTAVAAYKAISDMKGASNEIL
jgi:chromosome segregation ATPase